MPDRIITVTAVSSKSGQTDSGRAWTRYGIKDADENWYNTFDGKAAETARALKGHEAQISYEETEWGADLTEIAGADEIEQARMTLAAENGAFPEGRPAKKETDWDKIGEMKTRCALWVPLLPFLYEDAGDGPTRETTIRRLGAAKFLVDEATEQILSCGKAIIADEDVPF